MIPHRIVGPRETAHVCTNVVREAVFLIFACFKGRISAVNYSVRNGFGCHELRQLVVVWADVLIEESFRAQETQH